MPLTVSLATDSDIPTLTALTPLAFAKDIPYSTIFPEGPTPAYLAHYTALDTEEFRTSTTLNCLKVIDSSATADATAGPNGSASANSGGGNIIAWAGWYILPAQTSADLVPSPPGQTHFPADARVELGARLFSACTAKRHAIMGIGQPYVFLAVLATHPDHQGKGAGSLCMKWGTDVADRLGVPCYLEATARGVGLYRKWGFEEMGRLSINLRPWREMEVTHLCMVRKPKPKPKPEGENEGQSPGGGVATSA